MSIPMEQWKWLGHGGHFIASQLCRFRLHTQVGSFVISTVGDYYATDGKRETLGYQPDSFYETMVFPCDPSKPASAEDRCGCRDVLDWGGLEQPRYATAAEAEAGHIEMCKKYASEPVWVPEKDEIA